MRHDHLRWRVVLCVLLIGLVFGEAVPEFHRAIYGTFDSNYLLEDRLIDAAKGLLMLIVGPLLVILAGVVYSEKFSLMSLLALLAIAIGLFVIYALRVGDPSGGILKGLSVLVYWGAAFLTLVLLAYGNNGKR